ncbi:MAG: glycogen/starch/alpha-glucan phosphorylase, partial [Pseudomonadota bacterium]
PDDADRFRGLIDGLRGGDWFMVAADFNAYWDAQREVDAAWADPEAWRRMAVINAAGMGRFSSDRTIRGYASEIWHADPAFPH